MKRLFKKLKSLTSQGSHGLLQGHNDTDCTLDYVFCKCIIRYKSCLATDCANLLPYMFKEMYNADIIFFFFTSDLFLRNLPTFIKCNYVFIKTTYPRSQSFIVEGRVGSCYYWCYKS